jgi:GNAT superfamily N-acetyltransferase
MSAQRGSVRVRRLERRDRTEWLALFKGYIDFYRADVPADVIDTLWERLLHGGEGFHMAFVAVDGADRPFGLAHVLFHRSTWSNGWYGYLEDLFVAPAARARGAGRALIEAVYQEADARQCMRVYWVTEETNAAARALYDRVATKAPFVQYRR